MQQHAFISCIHLYVHMYCWRVFLGLLDERAHSHSFYFQPHLGARVRALARGLLLQSLQQPSPEQLSSAQSSSKESKSLSFQTQGAIFESCLKLQLASQPSWSGVYVAPGAAQGAAGCEHIAASCLQAIPAQVGGHFLRGRRGRYVQQMEYLFLQGGIIMTGIEKLGIYEARRKQMQLALSNTLDCPQSIPAYVGQFCIFGAGEGRLYPESIT